MLALFVLQVAAPGTHCILFLFVRAVFGHLAFLCAAAIIVNCPHVHPSVRSLVCSAHPLLFLFVRPAGRISAPQFVHPSVRRSVHVSLLAH